MILPVLGFDGQNLSGFAYFALILANKCLHFVNDTPLIVCYTYVSWRCKPDRVRSARTSFAELTTNTPRHMRKLFLTFGLITMRKNKVMKRLVNQQSSTTRISQRPCRARLPGRREAVNATVGHEATRRRFAMLTALALGVAGLAGTK